MCMYQDYWQKIVTWGDVASNVPSQLHYLAIKVYTNLIITKINNFLLIAKL